MKFASLLFALGFLASALASRPALAATQTASFSVTVTVASSCQISASATASGTYTATRANAATPVSVTCTNSTPYNVSHSTGLTPSITEISRKAAGPEIGNGSSQPDAVSGQSAGAQHVLPSAYVDTITVTY
jgi:spore coat protein U-like protein